MPLPEPIQKLMPKGRDALVRVALCLAAGGLAGFFLVPKHGSAPPPAASGTKVLLDGKPLTVEGDEDQVLDAARAIARERTQKKLVLASAAGPIERTAEELGARVEDARLIAIVAELRDPKSTLRRGQAGKAAPLSIPVPLAVDPSRALSALVAVKDAVDKPPTDARLDLATRKVAPDEPGRRVDVYATLARVDAALQKGDGQVDIVIEAIPATRNAASIKDFELDDVLGYFETKYARDLKHEARTFNLKLAASKLDGFVLMPGETFDFNDVVGPRNEANGYKIAPVIAQGELVDGIGGGTCQIAGTLHGAAFFGGLDIVERKPHTRPSFYIKMGMDAAVAYPTITLKLRNPFPFPVALHETLKDGVVRAEILGPKRNRDVTFVRKVNEVTPFQEKEMPDPRVPKGERVLAQRGIPGFKITRYRVLRDGPFAVRERMNDVYPSTTQIWRVGTGDPDPKFESHDDEHPEYVADEYLAISQGPHVILPKTGEASSERGGAMVESRVAGKYGTHGWTVREGFAKATSGTGGAHKSDKGGVQPEDGPGVD